MKTAKWRKRLRTHAFAVAAVLLLYGGQGRAEVVQLDLFSLGMPATFNPTSGWQTDFDLGVTFAQISHVYIDWSGEITGGMAVLDPTPPPNPVPAPAGIYVSLTSSDPFVVRRAEVYGGTDTYPDPEPFALLSEIDDDGLCWSDLVDGQGSMRVGYTGIIMGDGYYTEHGSVTLTKAVLLIDGTVIPEPATVLLLGVGALYPRMIRSKRSGQ